MQMTTLVAYFLAQMSRVYNEDCDMNSQQTDAPRFWLKISLHCPLMLIEPVTDLLGVLSGAGVEQSPDNGEGCTVSAYFAVNVGDAAEEQSILTRVRQQMEEVFSLCNLQVGELTLTRIDDQDWATSWKQFFTPFEIIPGLVIKPSWEHFQPGPAQQIIEMDPGMAFGTGQHASTALALDLISQSCRQQTEPTVLDIGTGTGILAIASVLFGGQQVLAIDNDPDAVQAARENVVGNGLADRIEVNAAPLETVTGRYQLVAANIVHDVLIAMAPEIKRLAAANGQVVLAGILRGEQEENILHCYRKLGFRPMDSRYREEWAALLLQHD